MSIFPYEFMLIDHKRGNMIKEKENWKENDKEKGKVSFENIALTELKATSLIFKRIKWKRKHSQHSRASIMSGSALEYLLSLSLTHMVISLLFFPFFQNSS